MQKDKIIDLYRNNKLKEEELENALAFLDRQERALSIKQPCTLEAINIAQLDQIIARLVGAGQCTIENIVILMRYYKVVGRNDLFIHLTKYTGSLGVIESMLEKLATIVDHKRYATIESQIEVPPLGTPLGLMPQFTKKVLNAFEVHLTQTEMTAVLADNHHRIPKEAFIPERVYYESASTFDDYLSDLHHRKIAELKQCQLEKRVWFEQEINDEVLAFVSANQEILSAVRVNDTLYVTKIPYDTKAYLEANTIKEKRYHACHCPFVKSVLQSEAHDISPKWCLCSAGFTKYPFEVLFDRHLPIECLSTPLDGDTLCRFAISLQGVAYKK
ncbi:MAG TPA: hypothetical protein PK340_02945 [Bacilli bacterium]|nr:hypothetical protein [Bacilli bacterium]